MKIDHQAVYNLISQIPEGRVSTYKALALKLNTKGYRAIGQIVGKNPNAPKVPCHRIVNNNGEISGYAFGVNKKTALLKKEGLKINGNKIVDFNQKVFDFL